MNANVRIFDRTTNPVTDMTGRRVRIVTGYPGYSEAEQERFAGLEGKVANASPDSEGDVYVNFDEPLDNGRTYAYARTWQYVDGAEAEPIDAPLNPIEVEPTPAEAQLERLIDAIYAGARTNGYMSLIPELFEEAGIPMRKVKRTAVFRGLRIISPSTWGPNQEALANLRQSGTPEGVVATLNRTVADYSVAVPWTEIPDEGERKTCSDLAYTLNEGDFADVPTEVLVLAGQAIGLGSNPDGLRRTLSKHRKAGSEYGISLSCDHC